MEYFNVEFQSFMLPSLIPDREDNLIFHTAEEKVAFMLKYL